MHHEHDVAAEISKSKVVLHVKHATHCGLSPRFGLLSQISAIIVAVQHGDILKEECRMNFEENRQRRSFEVLVLATKLLKQRKITAHCLGLCQELTVDDTV